MLDRQAELLMLFESAGSPDGESSVTEMIAAFGGLLALAVLTFPAGFAPFFFGGS